MNKLIKLILCCLFFANLNQANANDNSDAQDENLLGQLGEIYTAGLELECIDYQLRGMCIWLKIELFSVSVQYSNLLKFYSPDIIAEVYHSRRNTPLEVASLHNKAANSIGSTTSSALMNTPVKLDNNSSKSSGFRSVHLMGNPMLGLHNSTVGSLFGTIGYCDSPVSPLKTYYHSDIDWFEWRWGFFEAIKYFTKIKDRVYDSNAMWGSLYPRVGWSANPSPFINAAMISLRAATFVSEYENNASNHIATEMEYSTRNGYKSFGYPKVNLTNGKWQPISPQPTKSCSVLPIPNISNSVGTDEPYAQNRNYIFMLWRRYTCCEEKGQVFMSKIEW